MLAKLAEVLFIETLRPHSMAATLAPFGHSSDYAESSDDGNTMPNGTAAFPLPGDPLLGVQLGIGLRVGAR